MALLYMCIICGAILIGKCVTNEREGEETCKQHQFAPENIGSHRQFQTHRGRAEREDTSTILPTYLTYELFPAVQVGGSENVVSLQWFQQKVVPDA